MKKLLIATTALVATAGMASAEITITGSANAGYYSGLGNADAVTVAVPAVAATAATATAIETLGADAIPVSAETFTDEGIYSNAGIVATMTGTTDGGLTFSASVDAEAGTEIDQGDFEFDGPASGSFGFGAVSLSGAFGSLTFDDNGIDNLYDDDLTAADVSYSTTLGGLALTIAVDAQSADDGLSISAGYSTGAMAFTLATSDSAAGTSASAGVSYAVTDAITLTGATDQAGGAESVQTIGIKTAMNGISVSASSANDSTWDVDLGYTLAGVALTYGTDETDGWDATASYALGGGASFKAGMNNEDSAYAGLSFAF
ncbi:porin [Amylibacter sp.]|nr:porin [Amylibacter sp.]MDB4079353.1 porin [Amylibacter sp.]